MCAQSLAKPRNTERENKQEQIDNNLQFTIYRPATMKPGMWYPFAGFVHLTKKRRDTTDNRMDPLKEVQRRAERSLGQNIKSYVRLSVDSSQSLPQRGEITLIPAIEGIEFNPLQENSSG